jgi:hypothetical protein
VLAFSLFSITVPFEKPTFHLAPTQDKANGKRPALNEASQRASSQPSLSLLLPAPPTQTHIQALAPIWAAFICITPLNQSSTLTVEPQYQKTLPFKQTSL